jgi:hypothetical protein
MMLYLACSMVAVLAGVFVLGPLFKKSTGSLEDELGAETEIDRLLGQKAVTYNNLRDLEFEHKMGRLSDADFQRLRTDYVNEAALILQSMERLGVSEGADDALEKEIASRKAGLFASASGSAQELLCCPSCGAAAAAGKKYCADCGFQLLKTMEGRH